MEHRPTTERSASLPASAVEVTAPLDDSAIRCLDDPLLGCTARAAAGVRLRGAPLGPTRGGADIVRPDEGRIDTSAAA